MEKQNDSKPNLTVVNDSFSAILHTKYPIYVIFDILWYEPHNSTTKWKIHISYGGASYVIILMYHYNCCES